MIKSKEVNEGDILILLDSGKASEVSNISQWSR